MSDSGNEEAVTESKTEETNDHTFDYLTKETNGLFDHSIYEEMNEQNEEQGEERVEEGDDSDELDQGANEVDNTTDEGDQSEPTQLEQEPEKITEDDELEVIEEQIETDEHENIFEEEEIPVTLASEPHQDSAKKPIESTHTFPFFTM